MQPISDYVTSRITPCGKNSYAVFDCDNTTVVNDLEETLFMFMLENMCIKIPPEKFAEVISSGIPDKSKILTAHGSSAAASAVIDDCTRDYRFLYRSFSGLGGALPLWQIQNTDEHADFKVKMRFLYDGLCRAFDPIISYAWITYLFFGMTSSQIYSLALQSHKYWLGQKLRTKTLTSPKSLCGSAGVISISYNEGLYFPAEMKELFAKLRKSGIDVIICSASLYEVVCAALCSSEFGYNIPPENVYAMHLFRGADGRCQNSLDPKFVPTFAGGKTETINTLIRARFGGAAPILAAGDSTGDFNMLTDFENMQIGLIVKNIFTQDSANNLFRKISAKENIDPEKYTLINIEQAK